MVLFGLPPTGDWMDTYQYSETWNKAQTSFVYAALTAMGTMAYPKRSGLVLTVLCILPMVVELLQALAPWLKSDMFDILAAFTGIILMRLYWVVAFKR